MQFKAVTLPACQDSGAEEGEAVIYYRLYRLSGPGGGFVGFEEIEAPDDVAALIRAEEFAGNRPLELWCGARKVGSIAAVPLADRRSASFQHQ
jgi:hypothetical protein